MYCTITPNKTGGCSGLIDYLDKEDSLTRDFANYLDKENQITDKPDMFFDGERRDIDKFEVIEHIDKSASRGFMKNESRFFSLTFNPSAKEIEHIKYLAYNEALKLEASGVPGKFDDMKEDIRKELFKQYAVECMDNYAKNFGREGIQSNKDLVWYGKVERDRYWKYSCEEVKHNKKILTQISRLEKKSPVPTRETADKILELRSKLIRECDIRKGGADKVITEMMPKSGDNYHIHVVVSRKAKDLNMKLSPLAKARSNDGHKVGDKTCKIGFDRNKFVISNEQSFDRTFSYQRSWTETFETRKLQKENPELYKEVAKEKYKEENSYTHRPGHEIQHNKDIKISGRTVEKVTQEAGLKYIREAKPYFTVIKTAVKGYSIMSYNNQANTLAKNQALKNYDSLNRNIGNLTKDIIMKGSGLSKNLSVVNPYIAAANLIKSGVQLAQGNRGQEY